MRLSLLAVFALCAPTVAAHADTFNFSYTGTGIITSGTLTTTATTKNGYSTITGIAGTRNGLAITGLDGVYSFAGNDNLFSPTAPYVDFAGFSYSVGAISYNVFYGGGSYVNGDGECSLCSGRDDESITFVATTAAVTPEPSSIVLLGTGLVGMFGVARRKYMSA